MTFADRVFEFYRHLRPAFKLPAGVTAMNPYQNARVLKYVEFFLNKFYADRHPRILVFGINPGRFGGGLTGVSFTDPVALENSCGIRNDLPKRRELSSEFIYRVVDLWGGPKCFFRNFFLTAVSPLGFCAAAVTAITMRLLLF